MTRKPFLLAAALLPLWSSEAMAGTEAGTGHIAVVVNLVILVGAVASLTVAFRLLGLVKGGALARGWQLWVISFGVLTFGQIIVLAEKLHLLAISFDLTGLCYLATVALWFFGLVQTRKVLG
jgi:hypothetical protein